MKKTIAIAFGLLAACSYAAMNNTTNNGASHNSEPIGSYSSGQNHPFFKMLRQTKLLMKPLTTVEAIEVSDVIVRGHLVSISEGRSLYHNNGYSNAIDTVLIKMSVSRVLKGPYEVGDAVYFEYMAGGIPIDHLHKNRYKGELLVLLRPPTWDKSSYTFINSERGLMHEVDRLYRLTNQRSLLIEERANSKDKTRISQPLENADPLFISQSFNDLDVEIPALSSGGSFGFNLAPIKGLVAE